MDKKNIQDIYKLTPLQEGMLFHSISAPDSGVYIEQFVRVAARLDVALWEQAWNKVIANNGILRTGFFWENLDKPVQVVKKEQLHKIVELDWSQLGKEQFKESFDRLLEQDKIKPFAFNSGELMRQTVIHVSAEESYFVWSYHHILLDGWSAFLVMDEVFASYDQILNGSTAQISTRPSFKSYVQWLQLQDRERDEVFWRAYLKGFSFATPLGLVEATELKAGQSLASASTYVTQTKQLDNDSSSAIDNFARAQRVTVNTLIQAAWAYVLAIYSGEDDVVFGTTVSGRPPGLDNSQNMVGLFINTLPTRIKINPMQTIGSWLGDIQEQQVAVREFEHSALTDIHGWSEVGRAQPLFSSMLAVESFPSSKYVDLPDLKVSQKTNYPLTLVVVPGRQLAIKSMFDSARFAPVTIARLIEHVVTVLQVICSRPDDNVGNISLLDNAAHTQLTTWNATDSPYSTNKQLDDFFSIQAGLNPRNIALVVGEQRFTYAELESRANQIANLLVKRGVKVGEKIALLQEPSFELIASIVAISKCGCAYAPLDNLAPSARLNTMIKGLGFKTLITHKKLAADLDTLQLDCIDLNLFNAEISLESDQFDRIDRPKKNLIYVIHTSGSTGVPKAAGVFHHAFVNFMEYWIRDFGFNKKDKVLLVNKVTFDLSQKNIWGALITGGELHLATDKYFDPESARALISREGITWINSTPSMAYAIIETDKDKFDDMRSMRYFFVGGEPVNKARIAPWILSPACQGILVNTYGPTECTDLCSTHKFTPDEFIELERPVTVGKALPNIQIYVLDRFNNPLPPGVSGEVIIGGISIGVGYLNSAEMTAEKFFPNYLDSSHNTRLYRTGDLGYFDEDGSVIVKGRVDFQVKIRGYRIELTEIDSALQGISWINDSVTLVKGGVNQQLVSYVVTCGDVPQDYAVELKSVLSKLLPEYMVPAVYIRLDSLPLNDNGKVNRAALPEPNVELLAVRKRIFTVENSVEETLLGIWKKVLNRDDIAVEDNFFELGGHSLSITQICSRIRKEFAIDIQISTLFDLSTIREQAHFIMSASRNGISSAQRSTPQKLLRPTPLPLSFAQNRLWFLQQFEPGTVAYNVPNVIPFDLTLCRQSLGKALDALFDRHESLRSCFPSNNGQPYQLIRTPLSAPLDFIDISHLPEQERNLQIGLIATDKAQTEFDITRDVLARFSCVKTTEEKFLLFVTMHHIVTDGWSMDIFTREIYQAYSEYLKGGTPHFEAIELDYVDYTLWQRSALSNGDLDVQIETLSNYLNGSCSTISLPYDHLRPHEKRYEGGIVKSGIAESLLSAAKTFSEEQGCTLFMTLMAVFDVLMYRLSGQEDFNIGSPIANRHYQSLENTIGFFVNTSVFRCNIDGKMSFVDVVASVRASAHKIYDNQDVPFELLVERINPVRSGSLQPFFQVMFALQTAYEDTSLIDENDWVSRFDLQVTYSEQNGNLQGCWEFDKDLFDHSTVKHFAQLYGQLLENLIFSKEQSIGAIPFYKKDEQETLLALLGNPQVDYPKMETIASLFEQQVAAAPDAIAAIADAQRITYAKLNECTNHLAAQLVSAGTKVNECVGLLMHRGIPSLIATLAIVKAGGAYVVIDPEYPEERLDFIIGDAEISSVITTSAARGYVDRKVKNVFIVENDIDKNLSDASFKLQSTIPASERLAYLAYTSGTTGVPKAVRITHTGVVRLVKNTNYCVLNKDTRLLHLSRLAFDASTFEIWGALLNGGGVVIYTDNIIDLPVLDALIKQEQVDTAFITSGLFNQWMASGQGESTGLKRILSGGDIFSPAAVANLYLRDKDVVCANIYGPTENTTFSTWFDIPRTRTSTRDIPIGKSIANSLTYVLDSNRQPVPWGVIGELYVGGAGLAQGYHNNHALTAEKFIQNPFSDDPCAKLFATGDLVRLQASGDIAYIARCDDQLKIRGFRVEPGEIRIVIEQHPKVVQAVVAVQEHQTMGKVLVAWFRCSEPKAISVRDLSAWLRSRLPEYMLPGFLVEVNQFAVNANGKLDRSNLPSPFELAILDAEPLEPEGHMEQQIWNIWSEILQRKDFGVECDFFSIGGQSLLAVRMSGALTEQLAINLPLKQFFSEPTIKGIVRFAQLADWAISSPEHLGADLEEGVI
jgi:amino acid adenylation domain-containing protein